jgi:hypothetical protein
MQQRMQQGMQRRMRQRTMGAMAVAGLVLGGAGVLRGEDVIVAAEDADVSAEIEYTTCAQGVLKECGTRTEQQCTQFVPSSGSGSFGWGAGSGTVSGSVTGTCISFTTVTIKLYKDRYKPKSATT